MKKVIVIGAGAAGLMAAIHAARGGAEVTVLERNEKAGKKIYLTGKGRCNVTNNCDRDAFLMEVARNARFLFSALSFFSPADMMRLLEENGCPVVTQRGRRVFPESEKASDVTKTLLSICEKLGVRICLHRRVSGIAAGEDGTLQGVYAVREDPDRADVSPPAGGELIPAEAVIIATGGVSYPSTGSTGDGYRFAEAAGHRVEPAIPSLVGLEAKESWPAELQGLSLKNVSVTLKKGKKTLYTEQGEMLFTHFGYSGPLILEASCHLPEATEGCELTLDLKPGLTAEQLDARLRRDLEAGSKKQVRNILPALMPASLAEVFPRLCGLPGTQPCNQVTGAQRQRLRETVKNLPLPFRGRRGFQEAIVTRGGVSVREVNPGTMESKKVPGLFFAGEVLDVDAHTGGYNLQIAFSTGALAGASAAKERP
ncbi:MAG: NAD(P)/FAD-dependent oxidoreductase [Clostridia bacterium]|nr:NAD(P)/FAD-dependent oxidoreductase [Clostridia bacterium]